MKYVLLAIFVLFAAQPLQASACDMHDGQSSAHSQHGSMHEDNNPAMDCCDDDAPGMGEGCSMDQCGACPAGMTAVKPSLVNVIFNTDSERYIAASDALMCRSKSPPFRPPIS